MSLHSSPYRLHRELSERIERKFAVCEWRAGDVDLWPILSQELFLDIFRSAAADTAPARPPFPLRAVSSLATPALNLWKSRNDLDHFAGRPHRADAIFLGDGVSLDRIDGSWRDRFLEPIIGEYERQGRNCFLMQNGNLTRLPWARPTFAANRIAARAAVAAIMAKRPELERPDHAGVMGLLQQAGVAAPSLAPDRIERRARVVAAQAAEFDRVLEPVQPRVAFTVTYYSGIGHAFALACRRRGILCVDVQHCPHDGVHRGYLWPAIRPRGYSTLPGLFWTWSQADAENIERWAKRPWHGAIAAGHTQVAALDATHVERLWRGAGNGRSYEREILVALQPIGGKGSIWKALADEIVASPPRWRWWIRRHPASTSAQDGEVAPLLCIDRRNVVEGEAAQIPLPALLGHMDALISLASGAAAEAEMFGVPAFFLDHEALDTFPGLVARGSATLIEVQSVREAIRRLPSHTPRDCIKSRPIADKLHEIDRIAADYSNLSRQPVSEEVHGSERIGGECQTPCAA
jgi:hypothetical protein